LMGILFPSHGEIIVGDVPVTKKTLPLIRKTMGMVFQDPDDQLFMPTVYDDIAFGPRNYLLEEEKVESLVMKAIDMVGIGHLKERSTFKLSGGEKRAVAIAAVLAMEPDILVMDEPTAALDPKARRRVMSYLKGFKHTKLITSHDLDMVYELCDRTIVIKDGEIAADGPTSKILTDAGLMEACGLEVPLSIQGCPVCGNKGS
jgi:cobalt/nickel transport system ATP-binding protein